MHYGLNMVPLGEYADPRRVVPLAQAAEAAGWEAIFVWDHLGFVWGAPAADPWVMLAAVAQATRHLKIGSAVTPLPRRRPHVVAHTLATLDLLSGGRVIFGAGLGGMPLEFTAFGEEADAGRRAAQLDEGLEVVDRLLRGETVSHHGTHYTVDNVTLAPLPAQQPRVPIWIGGESRPALRRAARWDGWAGGGDDEQCQMIVAPEQVAERVAYIQQHRAAGAPFDVALSGCTPATGGSGLAGEYADAGATWWLESLHGRRGSYEEMLARVQAGPPI